MNKNEHPITDKQLGAIYETTQTTFNVWAPTHQKIKIAIYESAKAPFRTLYPMDKASDGVFTAVVHGDLHGQFYTYIVEDNCEVTDPYSVSTSANSLRSAIVDLSKTNPENWETHHRPRGNRGCDAILYEVHVNDFSGHKNSGMTHKGKFLAFSENGTSIENTPTGIDHIVDLGVTHVHLMPIYDYLTVDEEVNDDKNYNWGYDPEHFNAPEGSYATNPSDPVSRILELKMAIQALHEKGLKVVLDVVYNHTFRTEHSNFNTLVPKYYHRTTVDGIFSNGSGCGNEFASEKPMGRKFIIDSLLYWATEFKVDGFRFDLMALIDTETILIAKEALAAVDSEIIIYGEPWLGGLSTLPDNKRVYKGTQCNQGFSLFNDEFRDAIKGDNDGTGKGYIHGNKDMKHRMHVGLLGSISYNPQYVGFTAQPCETINYFNAHDNLILYDKLRITSPDVSHEELIRLNKLTFNLLFTAQGTPFFHAGNEFLRDKKGHHNSYNAPLSINAIDWQNKVKYLDFYNYVKGLISLRKTYPCLRLKSADEIRRRVHFIEDTDFVEAFRDGIVYIIKNESEDEFDCMLIAHNPGREPMLLSVTQIKDAILEYYNVEEEKEEAIISKGKKHDKRDKHHSASHHTALVHTETSHASAPHASAVHMKSVLKNALSNEALNIELIFDERGLLESPEVVNPLTHHLVRINPISSSIYKLGKKR